MAYTETDLANVQAAILALASGTRVVRLSIGDKSIEYGAADINTLKALRDEIRAEVRAASGGAQFVLTQTSKGL